MTYNVFGGTLNLALSIYSPTSTICSLDIGHSKISNPTQDMSFEV